MDFASLQKASRYCIPAIILDRFLSHKTRRIISWVLSYMLITLLVVLVVHFLLTRIDIPEQNEFITNLIDAAQNIYGLAALVFSLWLFVTALNAFYYSHYFRGAPSVVVPELSLGGVAHPKVTYEVAEFVYTSLPNDLAVSFLRSEYGLYILNRAGVTTEEVIGFLKGKRVPVPASICTFTPTGNYGMVTLEDIGRELLNHDKDFLFFLTSRGISREGFLGALSWVSRMMERHKRELRWWSREKLRQIPGIGQGWAYGGAYRLERHAINLTKTAAFRTALSGAFVKRDVEELESVLAKKREANALIVGEDGGAKTEILYEFARRIDEGSVLPELRDKRVFMLRGVEFVSALASKQEFESEFTLMMMEAAEAGDVILAIDDLPGFLLAAERTLSNALALLEPYLDLPSIHVVALSSPEGYHRRLEHNDSASRFFERMIVKEKSADLYIELLEDAALSVEAKEKIMFTYPAISATLDSAERYYPEGVMPDKAIDLLYDIGPLMKEKGRTVVKREDVFSIVKERTGIPVGVVTEEEKKKLLNLEQALHERVIGQDAAVKAIADALKRSRSGLGNPDRPMGSFLFLGPTGVGKTETVKALADIFFGSKDAIIRLDMSEFRTADSLERLIGYFEGGIPGVLSSKLREQQYGILLLDEFEKTSEKVLDFFLPILDEGAFRDMGGKKVNVKNFIIIATSNAGSDIIWNALGPGKSGNLDKQTLIQEIVGRGLFKPELLNRFDGVIVFHPLSSTHLSGVARNMLQKVASRLKEKGIDLQITDDLVSSLVEEGSDPAFGARPMNRAIQDKVEAVIAEKMLRGEIEPGSSVTLSREDLK